MVTAREAIAIDPIAESDKYNPPRPPGAYIVLEDRRDGENGRVWKIRMPAYYTPDWERVNEIRLAAIRRREKMLEYQKWCGAQRDAVAAKFFKGEAADAMKEYRAACLLLGKLACDPPQDSTFQPEWKWSVELAPWVDRVFNQAASKEWTDL